MADRSTPAQRSFNMSRIRKGDTDAEMLLRRALHSLGFRYALHKKDLPGSPDIALTKYRTVIFVHGCFWHGHKCYRAKIPTTRTDFWTKKIEGNSARDERVERMLAMLGWRVIVVWECALRGSKKIGPLEVANRCATFLHATKVMKVEIPTHSVEPPAYLTGSKA
ncbi:DNA mismatch endonuclease Vsr [Stenotrophomonas sp. MA5]|jgi:DNA mismatch endonuclease (patch repair protein)|uniref:very short patch repair endonuclease n=1 Tax=Stenotrophomonas sp. MA5 TaxID=2508572 RepID=UPI001009E427|nr:DNA mismatch endonuclease Vsr [Stenotrophomonas sp. MA5]RXK68826.1 DNA mismatch endonuclease Vsr [Stenotrophomonas sp. MA5]